MPHQRPSLEPTRREACRGSLGPSQRFRNGRQRATHDTDGVEARTNVSAPVWHSCSAVNHRRLPLSSGAIQPWSWGGRHRSGGYFLAVQASHGVCIVRVQRTLPMNKWQKPSFEDLEMNAEIGGYQADDGGREDPPFVHRAESSRVGSRVAYLVADFLGSATYMDAASYMDAANYTEAAAATQHG